MKLLLIAFRPDQYCSTETSTDNDEGLPRTTLHGVENPDIRYRASLAQDRLATKRCISEFHVDFI
jgi:hypothetical protein